jgi:biotin transport system substrate-specific component
MVQKTVSRGVATILRTDRTQISPGARMFLQVVAVVGFAALTCIAAQIRMPIPGTPIPLTLQTFAVLLGGAVLGMSRGGASQGLYVAAGVMGAPVFAGAAGGWGHLIGPTGGYLIGFVLGAALVGWLVGKRENPGLMWLTFSTCMGSLLITLCGIFVLALYLGGAPGPALFQGAILFTPWNLLKAFAAAATARILFPVRRALG